MENKRLFFSKAPNSRKECPDGSETALYAASDAGHTWPGLEDIVDGDGNVIHDWVPPINHDFSATEVIWEFLGRQSRG